MNQQVAYNQILAEATACFLSSEINFLQLSQTTDRLLNSLIAITALDEDKPAHRDHLLLDSGKSIGSIWAAMCLKDLLRTKKFVRGLYHGIRAAQEKFPATPIHILYAGTGPFAALALPMTQLFSPEEIQFTLLEIQPESAAMLQKTVSTLQIEPFIQELTIADATQYRANPAKPIHVLLSETMQRALVTEPQVAITMNLAPQLQPGGILIPERIDVWAGLLDPKRNMENKLRVGGVVAADHILLQNIFSLDRSTASFPPKNGLFPPREVMFSPEQFDQFPTLCLFTEIQVFGDETIRKDESGLTNPLVFFANPTGTRLSFQYEMNDRPGFRMLTIE